MDPTLGLPAQKDAWYRYTWDRSLFLIYRRKELQSVLAELDFSQQVGRASMPQSAVPWGGTCLESANVSFLCPSEDIDGLEVVGRGQPFSSVRVEESAAFERSQETPSEDKVHS